jgi:predicted DNA-binding WGR domain protein
MSEQWEVSLVFTDDRSNKFWRARTRDNTLYINYGRVGTGGQTSVKKMSSAAEAAAALVKQADGKRRKGYVDQDGGLDSAAGAGGDAGSAAAPAVEPDAGPRTVTLVLDGGRRVAVRLTCEGATVRTEVTETYDSDAAAGAAFARILEAMGVEGYRREG